MKRKCSCDHPGEAGGLDAVNPAALHRAGTSANVFTSSGSGQRRPGGKAPCLNMGFAVQEVGKTHWRRRTQEPPVWDDFSFVTILGRILGANLDLRCRFLMEMRSGLNFFFIFFFGICVKSAEGNVAQAEEWVRVGARSLARITANARPSAPVIRSLEKVGFLLMVQSAWRFLWM